MTSRNPNSECTTALRTALKEGGGKEASLRTSLATRLSISKLIWTAIRLTSVSCRTSLEPQSRATEIRSGGKNLDGSQATDCGNAFNVSVIGQLSFSNLTSIQFQAADNANYCTSLGRLRQMGAGRPYAACSLTVEQFYSKLS